MNTELFWLTMTILATALFWLPYIINRIFEHKLIPALRNPNRDARPKAKWANRLMYAHENAVENLVLFVPLVLIVHLLNLTNETTALACMIYFFTRIAHVMLYTLGISYLRTLAFFIGFLMQMQLGFIIISSF